MQHSPVRGKGSNQFADKPPALVTAPPPTAGGQQAAAGVATASPFAQQQSAPSGAAAWKAELDGIETALEAERQTAVDAAVAAQHDKVEKARAFLAESPEPPPGHSPVYHEQARRTLANAERDAQLRPYSPAIALAQAKQRLVERARTDADRLEAAGLPADAIVLDSPGDRELCSTIRRDPDTGRCNVEVHHADGTVEHMTGVGHVDDRKWGFHSAMKTDQGNTYWRQHTPAGSNGPFWQEARTEGNWPQDATIIVRRPFDTTVDNQLPRDPNLSPSFGW